MPSTVEKFLRKASGHAKSGEVKEAEAIYRQVLSQFPKNKRAIRGYHKLKTGIDEKNLSNSEPPHKQKKELIDLFNDNRWEDVLQKVTPLISLFPLSPSLYNLQGASYAALQMYNAAITSYERAIKIDPVFADAYLNRGSALQEIGDLETAIQSFNKTLAINPQHPIAFFNMGNALTAKGELGLAIECYKNALKIRPDNAEAYFNMGNAFKEKGELNEAIDSYKKAIKIRPNHTDVHLNMGIALANRHDLDAAIQSYKKAIKIRPDYAEALNNIGTAYKNKSDFDAALKYFQKAIKNKPDYAAAFSNMGATLQLKGELEEAMTCYKQAIKIMPDYTEAYINIGTALERQGDLRGAIKTYCENLKVHPGHPETTTNLIYAMNRSDQFEEQALCQKICSYAQKMEAPFLSKAPRHTNSPDPDRCLQIGFVSGDFRNHPVAMFFKETLDRLAGSPNLTLHAYYNNSITDSATMEIQECFQYWNAVGNVSDEQLTRRIAEDKIDILIDLSNHTAGSRLAAFARRPAPLQVTAVGMPRTSGLSSIDYYFGNDDLSVDQHFSESYVLLPSAVAFKPLQVMPAVNMLPALTNGFVTFGSFNNVIKISRECISMWSRLLRELPDSRLLFAGQNNNRLEKKFQEWFSEEQVGLDRVDFKPRDDFDEYCRLHHKIDVHLTSFPVGGTTTIANALMMGVPSMVLSDHKNLKDSSGRVLNYAGLRDYILKNEHDFIKKGCSLAGNLTELEKIRQNLREKFSNSVYCNADIAAAGWEAALRIIWKRWCANLVPEPIKIKLENLKYPLTNNLI